ncbi:hypothetical protein EX290_03985 [Enterococcus faecium]|nr:hypothetical protein [Enterococcus faecium]NAM34634.1 hypothetical protein [Enterococcus faecium]NAM42616.1 hypothetical protein [Enterococcus faecium]NAM50458.1 hypothetical protein [Enterococcus faecium]NAM52938.1 hypothetical protein [Enterococcus faecium]
MNLEPFSQVEKGFFLYFKVVVFMESDISGITNCCNVYIVNQNDNYWRKNLWKKQKLIHGNNY